MFRDAHLCWCRMGRLDRSRICSGSNSTEFGMLVWLTSWGGKIRYPLDFFEEFSC